MATVAEVRPGRKRMNKRPAAEKHLLWFEWKKAGMSQGEIAAKYTEEFGEPTSADTVKTALARLRRG